MPGPGIDRSTPTPVSSVDRFGNPIVNPNAPVAADPSQGKIDTPKPPEILAKEKELGREFEPIYAQGEIQRGSGAAQTVEYGPPIGYRYDNGQSQYVNFDTKGTQTSIQQRGGQFQQILPILSAIFLPGIGQAITEALISTGVVTAGATANALGLAIAKTAVGVAGGQKFEDVLKSVIVDTIVSTGSIKVASAINEIVGMPNVTNAIVSASGSAIKTVASGGNEDDIKKSFIGGLAGSVAASAYIGAVNNASQTTSDVIQSGVGGYVIGGSSNAITNVINTLAGKTSKQTFKSAEDIEYEKLKALDDADNAVEAAFSTLTPSGTLTAEDIEYQKQKALDDLDAEVAKIFATVTVSPSVKSAEDIEYERLKALDDDDRAKKLATVTVQATQNVTQEIIDLINSTVSPSVATSPSILPTVTTTFSEFPTVTVLSSPTVSVSPEIFSTVTVSGTQTVLPTVTVTSTQTVLPTVTVTSSVDLLPTVTVNVTQILIDQILNTVTVTGTPTVLPTVTVTGTQNIFPTVTVNETQTFFPTVTVRSTETILPTVTVRSTETVLPTVTVRSTETVLPTVTVSGSVNVLPTVTITGTVTPTVTVTSTVSPTVSPTVTPNIKIFTTVTPPKSQTPSSKVLAGALSISPYRGAGEIEDPSTGKKRKKVWNEETLRLKDALGV